VFLLSAAAALAQPSQAVQPQSAGAPALEPTDLTHATAEAVLKVYNQLSSLQGSDQYAVTENAVLARDAGTFMFEHGRLAFAAPVAGRVVASVFTGEGVFRLDPPTEMDRRQISRFTKESKLEDGFREAVFFFSDDSWAQLAKLVNVRGGGDADAASHALDTAQKQYRERLNGLVGERAHGRVSDAKSSRANAC
jgi:hypothetical protein